MRKFLQILLILIITASLLCGGALAVTVEQVQVCMPAIDVYMYEEGQDLSSLKAEDVSADLGGTPLEVVSFGPAEQGIFYVYLLDVSASMPDGHFKAACAALAEAASRLREQDALALITFGSDVRLLLKGGESRSRVESVISALSNTDKSTKFYTAMNGLVDLVEGTEDMRRVAVVISDGIDDTDAGMTQDELEQKLIRTGVSVSGMCIDASTADVENFGELIRISGGELYTFGEDNAVEVLDGLLDRLGGGWHLELQAPTNHADGVETKLNLRLGEAELALSVTPENHTPDERPPKVESVDCRREAGAVYVTFSEPVEAGEALSAYALTADGGEALSVASVEALSDVEYKLTLESPLPDKGGVTLTVSGLRDLSMESNEMYRYSELVWSGEADASPAPSAKAEDEPFMDPLTIIIIAAAIILAAAAAFVVVRLTSQRTEPKEKKPKKEKVKNEKPKEAHSGAVFMFMDSDVRKRKKSGKEE